MTGVHTARGRVSQLKMTTETTLSIRLNGEPVRHSCEAHRTLLEVLRDALSLTGTKHGCDLGDCGACTVLVDGQPRLSCITVAADMDGRDIRTIEGLATGGILGPVQRAIHEQVAAQCGYCTPGIALCLSSLLDSNPDPSDDELRESLASNICRCTGYTKILAAARDAIRAHRGERDS